MHQAIGSRGIQSWQPVKTVQKIGKLTLTPAASSNVELPTVVGCLQLFGFKKPYEESAVGNIRIRLGRQNRKIGYQSHSTI
jgi:hypothetical protein